MSCHDNVCSVQKIVAGILDRPADQINCDIPIRHIPGWDNILHMTLIFRLQDEIGQRLTHEQVVECSSVRDFAELLDLNMRPNSERRH